MIPDICFGVNLSSPLVRAAAVQDLVVVQSAAAVDVRLGEFLPEERLHARRRHPAQNGQRALFSREVVDGLYAPPLQVEVEHAVDAAIGGFGREIWRTARVRCPGS